RHEAAFSEVQPVQVTRVPRIGRCNNEAVGAITMNDVVDDRAGLGENNIAIAYHGRFAERMDVAQGIGGRAVRLALEALEVVRQHKLLQEPDDALRARCRQVIDRDQVLRTPRGRGAELYQLSAAL